MRSILNGMACRQDELDEATNAMKTADFLIIHRN